MMGTQRGTPVRGHMRDTGGVVLRVVVGRLLCAGSAFGFVMSAGFGFIF